MKKTDWYNKDIEEILDLYYDEFSNEQMLDHLMFWAENYPELDFEWVDMMLDISNYDNIPAETILTFANWLIKFNAEHYNERYEFIEYRILEYAFFNKDEQLIKQRLEILKQNPVVGIDTVVTDTIYQLLYNGYFDLALDFSNTVWKPLSQSDKLIGYPEYAFVLNIYLDKLEKQYELIKLGKKNTWDKFIKEIKTYGFDNNKDTIDTIYNALSNPLEILDLEELSNKDLYLVSVNIHFLIYMKEKYNIPFMLSDRWFNIINTNKLLRNKKSKFLISYQDLDKHITSRYDNFMGSNQIEIFGKLWGLSFVYEFLSENNLIAIDDYRHMQQNIAFLKHDFVSAFNDDLWKLTFIFSWPNGSDEYQNLYKKELFEKTSTLDYYECKELIKNHEISLPDNDRIEKEISKQKQKNTTVKEDSFYDNETPYVKTEPKTGRNDPCPCGSGKKFKKCCMNK